SHRLDNNTVWPFEITTVHKGSLKVGQSINLTALEFFQVYGKGYSGNHHLKEDDKLFFFGDLAKSAFLYPISTNAVIYWPAPSGIRLVVGEKAVEFYQISNPGPYG